MSLICVITIGGSPEDLATTANSLFLQRDEDWEWLVFSAIELSIEGEDVARNRIRVIHTPEILFGARQTLLAAVEHSQAEAHVMVVAGDVLSAESFRRIREALDVTGAEIVYGDVGLGAEVDVRRFDPSRGWRTYEQEVSGVEVRLLEAFDPSPAILLEEEYVQTSGLVAASRTFRDLVGTLADTERLTPQLLIARAMTNQRKVAKVNDVFVQLMRNPEPPTDYLESLRITNGHLIPAVESWAMMKGLEMLDLGAAHNPQPGYQSVDLEGAAINCDVRDGLPLSDSSVGVIRAVDFMEHINPCRDSSCDHGAAPGTKRCVVGMMNEFHRVLAPGGWLFVRSPSSDGRGAFQDPTHVSYWNPNSFWYYTRRDQQRFVRGITCRFQAARLWQDYPNEWHRQNHIPYVFADLVALKGQRQPGLCEI